ncbi:MAG: prolyl oligopeptidase family serine peptidase [Odoribacter sp.]|nr:prolyl oligopeptidase family serine peptidase [Odoribacter sp.]
MEEENNISLYSLLPSELKAEKIPNVRLNTTNGKRILWLNDDEFLTLTVPNGIGEAPQINVLPKGPIVQESTGQKAPARTYQDLLKNPQDEKLFDYYFTSQLVKINNNSITKIGSPAIYSGLSLSPDGTLLFISTIEKPYSYQVPMYYFPRTNKIIDLTGKDVLVLGKTPELNLPMGYDIVSPYPRSYSWRPDKPATLYWVEAQDEGNPNQNKVEHMDYVYKWNYPFKGSPRLLAKTEKRFGGIDWKDDNFALLREYTRATRRTKTWQIKPSSLEEKTLLFDLSTDDRYNDPGSPLTVRNQYDRHVLYTDKNNNTLLMLASGASPEGDKPYISSFNLKNKKADILWQSQEPYYETIVKVTDPDRLQLITSRQSVTEPRNLYLTDLKRKKNTKLTDFTNPYPSMEGVTKEKIHYKWADGINLTATVYLPAGYDKEKDGRLPVLMWAYPREYRSQTDASQVRGSQHTFTTLSYGSPVLWVNRGYCIMDNVEMPIVSAEEGKEPNDNFVEQLVMNAEAAAKVIYDMGVGDTTRLAVGGHSYGAFMTANLLTHTNLFKAGLARSGAYNRTLTPFGFQAETRTYWEAPEVYNTMSPFMYADKLNGALLLIHGEMDNNTGTFPMQSERYFQALKGHGAITKYVILPYESHGYSARENVLHMLYECDEWLEKYVKNAH